LVEIAEITLRIFSVDWIPEITAIPLFTSIILNADDFNPYFSGLEIINLGARYKVKECLKVLVEPTWVFGKRWLRKRAETESLVTALMVDSLLLSLPTAASLT